MSAFPKITFMVMVADTARADIALTSERTYYRFATDTSIEDGELRAIDNYERIVAQIVDAALPREGETALPSDIRMQLFVNNRINAERPTEQSLDRLLDILSVLFPEFSFLQGFKA